MPAHYQARYGGPGGLYRRQNSSAPETGGSSTLEPDPPSSSAPPTPSSAVPTTTSPPTSTPPTSTPPTTTPPPSSSTPPPSSSTPPSSSSSSSSTPPSSSSTPPSSSSQPPTSSTTTLPPTTTTPTSTPPTSTPPTSTLPTSTSEPPTSNPTTEPPPPPTTTEPTPSTTSTTIVVVNDPSTRTTITSSAPSSSQSFRPSTIVQNGTTLTITTAPGGGLQTGITATGGDTKANIGAIVGGVIGGAALLGALLGLLLFIRHRRRKRRYDGLPQKPPPRPTWTPLSPLATLPHSPDPVNEPYYDVFRSYEYEGPGPCATQPLASVNGNGSGGLPRSNPDSQYSTYSQLSTVDDTPESSTRALIKTGFVPGATGASGAAASAEKSRPLSNPTTEESWHDAKMYQDHFFGPNAPGLGPVDREIHSGTPTESYAWGAASPKRKLGMTNPDPETPNTPRDSFIGLSNVPSRELGVTGSASGTTTALSTVGASAAGAAVPILSSPPRPPRSDRRISFPPGAQQLTPPGAVPTSTRGSGTTTPDMPKWDAIAATHSALVGGGGSHAGPSNELGLAVSLPPGASQPTAGRQAVPKPIAAGQDSLRRKETLPPQYDPHWEEERRSADRRSAGTFGDMKRELLDRMI